MWHLQPVNSSMEEEGGAGIGHGAEMAWRSPENVSRRISWRVRAKTG